jgi:hypothetical protein
MTLKIKKKWKVLIVFLLAAFIYSAVVNCKHYGYDTPVDYFAAPVPFISVLRYR